MIRSDISPTFMRQMTAYVIDENDSALLADAADPPKPRRPWDKFSDLAAAILEVAINDYTSTHWCPSGATRGRLQRDAERWFNGQIECFYTFELVCDLLNLDPGWTRRKIFALRRTQ